jgi:hypothetical protein
VKTAIIGWGYLIWEPGSLDVDTNWYQDGPRLPVEFARFASGPRLLPVLVEGAPTQPAFWTLSRKATVLAAAGDLAVRESIFSHDVGYWSRDENMRSSTGIDAIIGAWVESKGLDGAVWRAAEPNLPELSPGFPSERVRLDWLRRLIATGRAAAAQDYFERMPAQIRTPFQALVERELGWKAATIPLSQDDGERTG